MRLPSRAPQRGMSLIESVAAMAIVSVLLISALNAAGSVWRGRQISQDQSRAIPLAEELMAEILAKPYTDPDLEVTLLGVDALESLGDRASYDDIDDYDSWYASPPEDDSGTAYDGFDGWVRVVSVSHVDPKSPNTTSVTETGVKRVSVSVSRNGRALATLTALRTHAWETKNEAGGSTDPATQRLLLVVQESSSLATEDQSVQSLAVKFGYEVTVIDDDDLTLSAMEAVDVVYMAPQSQRASLATDVRNSTTGVVLAERQQWDFFGMSSGVIHGTNEDCIDIVDASHPISDGLSTGNLKFSNGKQDYYAIDSTEPTPAGADVIAHSDRTSDEWTIVAVETGGRLVDGRTAPGRRAAVPWVDSSRLSSDGETIMRQIMEWAEGSR